MSAPYYADDLVTIYHGDSADVLEDPSDLRADVCITDPPYNVGKDYGAHDDTMADDLFIAWLGLRLRLAAQRTTHGLVYFPGTRNVWTVPEVLGLAGLTVKRMLGWHRKEFAGDLWSGGPAMSWEPIVWAPSEQPHFNRVFGNWGRDFLVVPSTHGNPSADLHPCPKPNLVMQWLVGLFVPPGGSVIDPFAGTGTTLWAAKATGRRAIGIEIEERYCEIAAQRCSQDVLGLAV